MWLKLIVVVLILAITFFQSLQGMYAAVTLAVAALIAAAVAFALQDALAGLLAGQFPELAQAIALGAVFVVLLVVLKLLADRYLVRSRIGFPMLVDRIGGGLFGLIAALLMVGTVAVCLQLLPLGANVLGFERYTVDRQGPGQYRVQSANLWFNPDGFTTGLMGFLSRHSLAGNPGFGNQHPDYLAELHWRQAGIPRASRHFVGGTGPALRIVKAWKEADPPLYTASGPSESWTFTKARRDLDQVFFIARVELGAPAADADGVHRFTASQFRLVGRLGRSPRQYFAVAVSDVIKPAYYVLYAPDQRVSAPSYPDGSYLDVVFEIDDQFEPDFVEYKSGGRAELTAAAIADERLQALKNLQELPGRPRPERLAQAKPQPSPPPPEPERPRVETPKQPGRAVEAITIKDESGTGVTARLPYEIRIRQGAFRIGGVGDNEVRAGKFVRGWFAGPLTDEPGGLQQSGPDTERVEFFQLPPEEPKIMVQLRGESTQARTSVLRSVFNSVRMMKQYSVLDSQNHRYLPAGYFAVVERDRQKFIELCYFPDPMERRGLMIWQSLRKPEINRARDVGLIYLVDPGPRRLERFSSQTSFFRHQILRIDIPAEMPADK